MQYLTLFLLFLAVLIAAWFYLQRAKTRDSGTTVVTTAPAAPTATPVDETASAAPIERGE